jgi:hypothetical protein
MSELAAFVKARALDNVVNGTVTKTYDDPLLFDVRMPEGKVLTLASAVEIDSVAGDVVQVLLPSGDRRQAYVAGPSATLLGGDAINKVLGQGQG